MPLLLTLEPRRTSAPSTEPPRGSGRTPGVAPEPPKREFTYAYDVQISDRNLPAGTFPVAPTRPQQVTGAGGSKVTLAFLIAALLACTAGLVLYLRRSGANPPAPAGQAGEETEGK